MALATINFNAMNKHPLHFYCLFSVACLYAHGAGAATYSQQARVVDAGGTRSASVSYSQHSSIGGISGISEASTGGLIVEAGYLGQIVDFDSYGLFVIESAGAVDLLLGEAGYYIDDESRSLKYEGAQLGEIPGWTYLGVESDESTGYHMMIRNDGTGEYVRWTLDSSGNIIGGDYLSVRDVQALESRFDQDLDGDEEIGLPPTLAP